MDEILDSDLEKVIVTTAPTVANKEIDHEIEIITAECVFGMNIFRDLFAGIRDIFWRQECSKSENTKGLTSNLFKRT